MERMQQTGSNLGGEPSGHILLPMLSRTGDGMIAALQILSILARTGRPASEVLSAFAPVPQKLVNLPDMDQSVLDERRVIEEMAAVRDFLGDEGRILLRPSGTEPLIRVMVEAVNEDQLDTAMDRLVTALKQG